MEVKNVLAHELARFYHFTKTILRGRMVELLDVL